MIIGITGGIGSGKTTLANFLRKHGFSVFDTDKCASILQDNNTEIILKTKALFGDDIYKQNKLDRPGVASLVFQNPSLLKALTDIVHPVVKQEIIEWAEKHTGEEFLFIESAVLFEGGFNALVDKIILITAPEEIRIKRVMERDSVTEEQVRLRIKNQIPDTLKVSESDLVINTENGLPDNLLESIIVW